MKRLVLSLVFCFAATTDVDAKQHRSAPARRDFIKGNPCPSTGKTSGKCPGYVIDHVEALACGGIDHPSNMQWQTIQEAKDKDRWELKACR